ncbi:MAG: hypothetical protein ACP5H5_05060, partial [Pyrobaculum sp.]
WGASTSPATPTGGSSASPGASRLLQTATTDTPRAYTGGGREYVVTPNDTLAHYGPSLPLDLGLLAAAVARGERWAGGTSSVSRPSLRDAWYGPYR